MTHEPPLKSTAQLEIKVVFHFEGVVLVGDTSKMRNVIEGARGKNRWGRFPNYNDNCGAELCMANYHKLLEILS